MHEGKNGTISGDFITNNDDDNNIYGKFNDRKASLELECVPLNETAQQTPSEPPPPQPVAFYKLFRYATCLERILVIAGLLLSIATGCGVPIMIILYGEFTTLLVDRAIENITSTPTSVLRVFGGGSVLINGTHEERTAALLEDSAAFGIGSTVVGLVQFSLGVMSISLLNYTAQKQIGRVRWMFLQSVLRQDMAWYDTSKTSNFASRITEDLDKLQDGIGEKMGIFLYLLTTFIISAIISFLHGWKLTLVILCCAPIMIVAQAIVSKVQSSLTAQELESYGDAGAVVEEVLSSVRTVVAFGGEDKEVARYTENLGPAKATGIKRGMFSGLGAGIMWFIIYGGYAIAFWYGVILILESRQNGDFEYTPGILVIVLFGVLSGAMNLGLTTPHLEAFAVARGSAAAVFSVLDRVPKIDSLSKTGKRLAEFHGDIQLDGVHFQYPARPEVKVLQGINLNVKSGEKVALVGSSGCGKSTVIQLIQRLYDPAEGKVLLDGVDVKELNVGWMRSHIGVVGQEPVLFGTTIKENIRYGREDATQQEIEDAAREANAHDFISKLPEGYETMVGERGTQLSGGQKQRIAIARALIRRPNILLLDEATSALDLHSEAKVQAALDRAAKGRTTLIVTHRLSTVKNADRIIFISGGEVVEQGSHNELLALRGHYHALVNADPTMTHGAGEGGIQHQENGSANGVVDSLAFRRQSTRSRAGSNKDQQLTTPLIEEEQYDAPLTRIIALNKPEWLHVLVGCIAAAAVGFTLPLFAILFGEVYGVLSVQDPEEVQRQTNWYCILFVVIGVVTGLGMFLQMHLFSLAGVRLTARLRVAAFSAMLRQEIGWFDEEKNGVGILCARLSGDAASVQGATGSRIGVILQSTSTLVIGIVLSLFYSWKVTLVSAVMVPVVFAGVFLEARFMHAHGLQEKAAIEAATKIAVEAIGNIRTVASLCGEQLFLDRYSVELRLAQQAARRKTGLRGAVFSLGQTAWFYGYGLSLYYGGYLVATEGLPYKDVIKISEALIFGAWMLGQTLAFAPNYNAAKMAAGRLFYLVDRIPRISSPDENANEWVAAGSIEYSQVKFQYPTRPEVPILKGLDLLIKPGQMVALVGPSGCGKSTCIQLLQRFYEPSIGTVSIHERNIGAVRLERLRSQMGIVSQEPVLFDRTIAENIAYGDNSRTVPMEDIIEAAKKANIHSFISSLPLGYETRLGSKGAQLSGGQKQRIAIARALVRNPRLLLLDEATSALDTHSEKVVQAALDQAKEGRTCITIAHRLATVQQADVICVLNQGVVAEMGSHAELLEKQGLYCQLLRQAASNSEE
ncbi:multidrug resistance protein homolog 49-like [Periplaneta americana]|uniref:multidrug resistance protein homolog 49-like n=1 Tax=Periplaneta americana TaxID=6978 RepID=UPI0037E70E1F